MRYKTLLFLFFIVILLLGNNVVFSMNYYPADKIVINLLARKLTTLKNDKVIKEYPVAVGKSSSQTPTGSYKVREKIINRPYYKNSIPGGSINNPLGTRWIGFLPAYGMHGNSNPYSVGTFASAGCVRLHERDVQELFENITIGTPVEVIYDPIEIAYDVFGENPILLVEPDYYHKERDLSSRVDHNLKLLDIYDKIPQEQLLKLKGLMRKQKVAIADTKPLMINGKYITKDLFSVQGEVYVNKTAIERFFDIDILSVANDTYGLYRNHKLKEKMIQEKTYVSLKDFIGVAGGVYTINERLNAVEYKVTYLLLNGHLLPGEVIDLLNMDRSNDEASHPKFPLVPLAEALELNFKINRESVAVFHQEKQIPFIYHDNQSYIDLENLTELLGVTVDVFTYNQHIELETDPVVIYDGKIYEGLRQDDTLYIPYGIYQQAVFVDAQNSVQATTAETASLQIKEVNGVQYIPLSVAANRFKIEKSLYGQKVYLK